MRDIDKMVELQRGFSKLYGKALVGISDRVIHVKLDFFLDNFKDHDAVINGESEFPYQFETEYEGARFIAIASLKDLEKEAGVV